MYKDDESLWIQNVLGPEMACYTFNFNLKQWSVKQFNDKSWEFAEHCAKHLTIKPCTKHFYHALDFYLLCISYLELKTLRHSAGVV